MKISCFVGIGEREGPAAHGTGMRMTPRRLEDGSSWAAGIRGVWVLAGAASAMNPTGPGLTQRREGVGGLRIGGPRNQQGGPTATRSGSDGVGIDAQLAESGRKAITLSFGFGALGFGFGTLSVEGGVGGHGLATG